MRERWWTVLLWSCKLASCALQWLHYTTHHQTKDTIRDASRLESDWLCEPIPERSQFMWIREFLDSFWLHKPYLITHRVCLADWYRVSAKRLRKWFLAGNQHQCRRQHSTRSCRVDRFQFKGENCRCFLRFRPSTKKMVHLTDVEFPPDISERWDLVI